MYPRCAFAAILPTTTNREPAPAPKETAKVDANLQPIPYVHNSGLKKRTPPKQDANTIVQLDSKADAAGKKATGTSTTPAQPSPSLFAPKISLTRSIFISAPRNETRPPKLQSSYQNGKDAKDKAQKGKGCPFLWLFCDPCTTPFQPHRPILVKIESVDAENGVIYISGHDLLNNTLILDIKPLHLSDLPLYQTICFPAWVHNSYTKQFNQLLRNQGVIGSPYGFATEQMVMNQQTANLMKLLSMRTTALAPTNNTVKPWFLALLPFSTKTQPVNSNNSNNSNSSSNRAHCIVAKNDSSRTVPIHHFPIPLLSSFLNSPPQTASPTTPRP
jgi:hypothetical protein